MDVIPYLTPVLVLAVGLFLWQVMGRRMDDISAGLNTRLDDISTGLNKRHDDTTRYLQDLRSDMQDLRTELHGLHSNHTRHLESHIQQLERRKETGG